MTKAVNWEPSIAVIRILACLFIVIFHTGRNNYMGNFNKFPPINYLIQYGDVGVPVFFILSGYLVFKNFKHQDPLDFLVLRAIRLFPLMWLIVTSMYILSIIKFFNIQEILFLDYLHAVTLTFRLNPLDTFLPPLWTLAYQVKFYAGVSLSFLLLLKFRDRKLALLTLIFLYDCLQYFSPSHGFIQSLGLGIYGNFFAVGVLVSIFKRGCIKIEKICAVFLLLFTGLNLLAASRYTTINVIILTFTCIFMLLNLEFIYNKKAVSILRKFDELSYPMFLIHFPLMLFALRKLSSIKLNSEIIYSIVFILTLLVCFFINRYFTIPVSSYLKRGWYVYRERFSNF